jgi:hypothetical protein
MAMAHRATSYCDGAKGSVGAGTHALETGAAARGVAPLVRIARYIDDTR